MVDISHNYISVARLLFEWSTWHPSVVWYQLDHRTMQQKMHDPSNTEHVHLRPMAYGLWPRGMSSWCVSLLAEPNCTHSPNPATPPSELPAPFFFLSTIPGQPGLAPRVSIAKFAACWAASLHMPRLAGSHSSPLPNIVMAYRVMALRVVIQVHCQI